MVKLPRTPPDGLSITEGDLIGWDGPLMRVHTTTGAHALPWHRLRHFGPVSARFDPHPPPPREHDDFAVQYAAGDLETVIAEVFQATRTVTANRPGRPHLTIWGPTRVLRLLDLTGLWPIRNVSSQVIASGPHPVCRTWSHAVACHSARVDGLYYRSTMTGGPAAALFLPAADAYPGHPSLSLPLEHPGLIGAVHAAARRISYDWD